MYSEKRICPGKRAQSLRTSCAGLLLRCGLRARTWGIPVQPDFLCSSNYMAEGEGFEPPVPFQAQRFSRPPVSTTHASLRVVLATSCSLAGAIAGQPVESLALR